MIQFEQDLEFDFVLNEIKQDDELPEASVYIVDSDNKVLDKQDVCHKSKILLPAKILNVAKKVLITPRSEELSDDVLASAKKINRKQLLQLSLNQQALNLPRRNWITWFPLNICVSGNVRKCSWRPFLEQLQLNTLPLQPLRLNKKVSLIQSANQSLVAQANTNILSPLFRRCRPICEGIVEVYERICCVKIRITPSIIDKLCRLIKEGLQEVPEIPFPIDPEIYEQARFSEPPLPKHIQGFFKEGAADELRINGANDLQALSSLSLPEAEKYILARPYLIQIIENCGQPVLKGATAIGEGGEFSFCYPALPYFFPAGFTHCRREVAFKVTQLLETGPRVIYNGVDAGIWFDPLDDITLTSYDYRAIACDSPNPVPGPDEAYVALARIGNTDSVHLESPDQQSELSVGDGSPLSNIAGLAFPEPNLNLAKGTSKNRNWGGVLPIRLDFSKKMALTNASHYRISIVKSNASGQPIESTREYLDSVIHWYYNEPVFEGGVYKAKKRKVTLTDSGDPTFHKIPYDNLIPADSAWRDNQYHAFINTNEFDDQRYLMTVELFDNAFNRVVPNGTGGAGDDQESFTYQTWNIATETTPVNYAALTHVLWWDNRPLTALIEDLRKNGNPNSAECQFMQKDPSSADARFSAGFRAFHEQHGPGMPDFLLNWRLKWKRGLGGTETTLDVGGESVGFGLNPEESTDESFITMLGGHQKCTFSLMLFAAAKTWNGSSYLYPNALRDVASFALDVSSS